MAKENNGYVSSQISKYQNAKKLLEFINKLVPAATENYATIHSSDGGAKSCIGMTLLDYSKGTGSNTVSVSLNISPSQIEWWYTAVLQRHMAFQMTQEKIMSFKKDANGNAPVTKMTVTRNATARDGSPSRCPWYICCENGFGRVQVNQNGGTSIAPHSYRMESQVFVNLTDEEMFRVLYSVHNFIAAWEATYAPAIIRAGVDAIAKQKQREQGTANNNYPAQQAQEYTPPTQGQYQQGQGYAPAQGQYQQPQNGYQPSAQNYTAPAPAPAQQAQNGYQQRQKGKKFQNPYSNR